VYLATVKKCRTAHKCRTAEQFSLSSFVPPTNVAPRSKFFLETKVALKILYGQPSKRRNPIFALRLDGATFLELGQNILQGSIGSDEKTDLGVVYALDSAIGWMVQSDLGVVYALDSAGIDRI
jgi:hypothetical protein